MNCWACTTVPANMHQVLYEFEQDLQRMQKTHPVRLLTHRIVETCFSVRTASPNGNKLPAAGRQNIRHWFLDSWICYGPIRKCVRKVPCEVPQSSYPTIYTLAFRDDRPHTRIRQAKPRSGARYVLLGLKNLLPFSDIIHILNRLPSSSQLSSLISRTLQSFLPMCQWPRWTPALHVLAG